MRNIKSKNTKPEINVRKGLFAAGVRYRVNCKDLPGTPDIAVKKFKIAIFINGCFWHGHQNCKKSKLPATNYEFWFNKISGNIAHDQKIIQTYTDMNWTLVTIWQCEISTKEKLNNKINDILLLIEKLKLLL